MNAASRKATTDTLKLLVSELPPGGRLRYDTYNHFERSGMLVHSLSGCPGCAAMGSLLGSMIRTLGDVMAAGRRPKCDHCGKAIEDTELLTVGFVLVSSRPRDDDRSDAVYGTMILSTCADCSTTVWFKRWPERLVKELVGHDAVPSDGTAHGEVDLSTVRTVGRG